MVGTGPQELFKSATDVMVGCSAETNIDTSLTCLMRLRTIEAQPMVLVEVFDHSEACSQNLYDGV